MDTTDKWLYLLAMIALVASALLGFFVYTRRNTAALVLAVLAFLAALYIGFRRDAYLPFLGESVVPCSLLKVQTPEHADASVTVSDLEPGAKVLYWAAEPATEGLAKIKTWDRAYLDFANAGVARVDQSGRVILRVRKPQTYTVPVMGRLEAHVHWRICKNGGMLGPVQITPLSL
jgi:hypothetical protein